MRRLVNPAALSLVTLLLHAGHAVASPPELLLTWNAPFGQQGATTALTRTCGDTTLSDTLYLSFRLKEDKPALSGISGVLNFNAQFTEHMSGVWAWEGYKPAFLRVQFAGDSLASFPGPWRTEGFGDYRYYQEDTRSTVRMIYAVPANRVSPLKAGVHSFARVVLRRPPDAEGCDQAICVEWLDADFTFSLNQPMAKGHETRGSFASANSPAGLACAKYRRMMEIRQAEEKARQDARDATRADTTRR